MYTSWCEHRCVLNNVLRPQVWCSVVRCGAVWCGVVQCVEVCCRVLQCVAALQCMLTCVAVYITVLLPHPRVSYRPQSTPQSLAIRKESSARSLVRCLQLRPFAACYSVLQCVAACCSMLQCVAECCRVLQWITSWMPAGTGILRRIPQPRVLPEAPRQFVA